LGTAAPTRRRRGNTRSVPSTRRTSYLTFTEEYHLTTIPIKFALPPFLPAPALPPVLISDFEFLAPTNNTNGTYFGRGRARRMAGAC